MFASPLYVITDEQLTPDASIETQIAAALAGGAKAVQIRTKSGGTARRVALARRLKPFTYRAGALLIVNDDPEACRQAGADGVHLGQEDATDLDAVREIVGEEAIIGVSCYGDLERAKQAVADGADYVAFGSMFPSETKPQSPTISLDVLKEAVATLKVPVVAIGGIDGENIGQVAATGIDACAVVSNLFSDHAPTAIQERAKNLIARFAQG
ncbi:MAG: thiamine phosphate synthase [Alphaproteobacteria bacterium CG_4_10_14_0_2_um_filter_63_37]|nr:MAG: thiamine-phosphate diphosphorylase [Proteobacteria bacterium CG1_02_64_396]PJA24935.1 MAG: thiamine phosphate synthase [Alphaproteobacteria bacterium CG_4_10_14_0_2_um_filter_63_37]